MGNARLLFPVLVTGAGGMLGRELCAALGPAARGLGHAQLDVTDAAAIGRALDGLRPGAIVNCAAWTDVDGAESHAEAAFALNAKAPRLLAEAARARGLHFITLSTDYVFDGSGAAPWPELPPPLAGGQSAGAANFAPLGVYGASKLAGEQAALTAGGETCVARTQWLYGAGGRNFIDTIARLLRERAAQPGGAPLKVVNDQTGAPTWTRDLAAALITLLERRATGVFHLVNSDFASWFEAARFVRERLGLESPLEPCATAEFPRPARRPANSRLSQANYASLAGAPLRPWQAALTEYLEEARL